MSSPSVKGIRKEYRILFTNKKSPIFRVGIMEPEGILFASKKLDLKAKTINNSTIKEGEALCFLSLGVEESDFFSGIFFVMKLIS